MLVLFYNIIAPSSALAQSNDSSSSTDIIVDIILPLVGTGAGLFGGYYLGNRSQLKFMSIQSLKEKADAYLDMIRNIHKMLHNPEFLNTVEDPEKIYATIKQIGDKQNLFSSSDYQKYEKWRAYFKELPDKDATKHKNFGEQGQDLHNSLVKQYNSIVKKYNKLTKENRELEKEDTKELIINEDWEPPGTYLSWK